jgi:hypothetical protein
MKAWASPVASIALAGTLLFAGRPTTGPPHWVIVGDLSEACSCMVPCPCNFGEGPAPHRYCWSVVSFHIEKGHYETVLLDDLYLAGGYGKKAMVWYIDEKATPEQAQALRAIAEHMVRANGFKGPVHFDTRHITQEVEPRGHRVDIDGRGGFEADYILGRDGKNPVVVENNTMWNIPRAVKAKTIYLKYSDRYGNKFALKGTNSNTGKFDWTDRTPHYF